MARFLAKLCPTFSITIYTICILENIFWSLPVYSVPLGNEEHAKYLEFLRNHTSDVFNNNNTVTPDSNLQLLKEEIEKIQEQDEVLTSGQESSAVPSIGTLLMSGAFLLNSLRNREMPVVKTFTNQTRPKKGKKAASKKETKKNKENNNLQNVAKFSSALALGAISLRSRRVFNRAFCSITRPSFSNVLNYNNPCNNLLTPIGARNFSSSRFHINAQTGISSAPRGATAAATRQLSEFPLFPEINLSDQPITRVDVPQKPTEIKDLSDREIIKQVLAGKIQEYSLEHTLGDLARAVRIRRRVLEKKANLQPEVMVELPHDHYDYSKVAGQCCENVLGYVPIPVGIVGPLKVNGNDVFVPLATTEGALVASTQRGAKALTLSGGVHTVVINDGMTRAPLLRAPSVTRAAELKAWMETPENYERIRLTFNSASRFAKLEEIKINLGGRHVYARFRSKTGDAMGMNMISKGVEKAMEIIAEEFPDIQLMSLSGNFCTDKKPSAVNWIDGRGKSVVCDATIPGELVEKILKTNVKDIVELNISKNLIGSVMAGSIGGYNAHAANIVTAIYLATGQDCAQNVESSNCMTLMEAVNDGKDLYISITMPSVEVGTVGGGTTLPGQSACLGIMGVKGVSEGEPGDKPRMLAQYVAATVMAGELSLMSALAAGDLVKSHMKLNRKK